MKRKCSSISCRHSKPLRTNNPRPLLSYEMLEDAEGNRKLVQRDPVAPSLAEDFSINTNALYNRQGSAPLRTSADLVDIIDNTLI